MDQPIKRHGGKSYLAKWIVSLFPQRSRTPNAPKDDGYLHYVEPFFGGGSVLFANDPVGISEVVNDLDGELACFWRVLKNKALFEEFSRIVSVTPFSEAEYLQAGKCDDRRLKRAVAFFIRNRQSRQALERDFATISRTRTRRGMNEQVSAWLSAIDDLPWFHRRLQRVLILSRPALKVIAQQDGPRTLFYVDPPYLHSTRSSTGQYAHEMTAKEHRVLLKRLAKIEGRFLLSG